MNESNFLIIMGAGVIGKRCVEDMGPTLCENFQTIYFFDNDKEKQGEIISECQVLNGEEFRAKSLQENCSLLIATDRWKELYTMCLEMGIEEKVIMVCNRYFLQWNKWKTSTYSQEGEEVFLKSVFAEKKQGFYVDVGAHHPFRFSNTYWAYKKGWSGINIEPNRDFFDSFEKARSKDININCGIASKSGMLTYYKFEEPAYNTFSVTELKMREPDESIEVSVRRLDEIFDENGVKEIDFLNIDVEGFEMEVLQSNNWDKYVPDYILLEQKVDSLEELVNTEEYQFLLKHEYQCVWKGLRTIIYKQF